MGDWKNATSTPQLGVVHRAAQTGVYDLGRADPGATLAPFVEHLWWVSWNTDAPRAVTTIPFPSVSVTVEGGSPGEVRHGHPLPAALVHGVPTRGFTIQLTGAGWVFGAKFHPGGWAAWSGTDASTVTDRVVAGPPALGRVVLAADDRAGALREHLSREPVAPSAEYLELRELVEYMRGHPELRMSELAARVGWSPRTLQRRVRRLVGVSPKWMLMRYRLQRAVLELEHRPDADLAELAARLGWYDQAHFTADFRRVLGTTPGRYAA